MEGTNYLLTGMALQVPVINGVTTCYNPYKEVVMASVTYL